MKVTLVPEVRFTMSLQQAIILKELIRHNINNYVIPGNLTTLKLPENANEILAEPLWNQLNKVLNHKLTF